MEQICCFDIGGTSIKSGVVDETGNIICLNETPTPQKMGAIAIVEALVVEVEKIKRHQQISKIAVSTAGIVDPLNGKILYANERIPNYTGCELSKEILQRTSLPCRVENDVKSAALGEMWKGAGNNLQQFLCITIGTGIGVALVAGGEIFRGNSQLACFGGEMLMGQDKFENYASTFSLLSRYEQERQQVCTGKEFFEHLRNKEAKAVALYTDYIHHLVSGILNFVYLFDPGTVLIGGGISQNNQLLLESIRENFYQRAIPIFAEHTKINLASLGNLAGLYGAASLFLNANTEKF